ncbi:MAG: response regulator [Endomicrobiales bacterium]
MSKYIAIIEDEPDIAELVALHLAKNGYIAKEFSGADPFFRSLKNRRPDLVVLDLMLPDTDGFEICKQLKKDDRYSSVPVIMLTAKNDETDKILGLELGADDYVTKPFSPKELVARVRAVLRRTEQKTGSRELEAGGMLALDPEKYSVRVAGKNVILTTTEFKVLGLLMSKKGKVFSREDLLDRVWGEDKIVIDRTIDVHIKNLREKLGKAGTLIKNVRGVGYKLEE